MNLNEEVRDDYVISAEMKKMWAVQMDLLEQVDQLCKRHDLKYFADGGTCLGAARHHGFIPWDDDIDLIMFYDDFVKFCDFAKKELKEPYSFQFWDTEDGFSPRHAKVRRTDTACFTGWDLEMSPEGNRGIFIDIMPMYNVPDDDKKFEAQQKKLKKLKRIFECYQVDRAIKKFGVQKTKYKAKMQLKWKFYSLFTTPEKVCQKFIDVASSEKGITKRVGPTTFDPGSPKLMWKLVWRREVFADSVDMPFEDRTIPVPVGYDERLTVQYGDWHKVVKNGSNHSSLHYSADIPYPEFLKKLKAEA